MYSTREKDQAATRGTQQTIGVTAVEYLRHIDSAKQQ